MATTSFSESFKYGSRLFGFFLAIVLTGGIGVGLGALLAIPEIRAWMGSGSVETTPVAGGLVLAVLGTSVLIIGHFGLIHKLIADGVSKGNEEPAVDIAAGPADTQEPARTGEPVPSSEQPDTEHGPSQAPGENSQSVAGQSPDSTQQPPAERGPSEDSQQPARASGQSQPAGPQPEDRTTEGRSEQASGTEAKSRQALGTQTEAGTQQETGTSGESARQTVEDDPVSREQTAEEIAFGSGELPDEEEPTTQQNSEQSGTTAADVGSEDETATVDEFEYPADDGESAEFDEEPFEEPDRSDIETAGDPSSDPLADGFDEE